MGEIMDIKLLYEDRDLVVCIKPVGVLSEGEGTPALLKELCQCENIYCISRLDRAVGGVMVYAKNAATAAKLSSAMGAGELKKEYLAVVHGRPELENGVMRDLLFKDSAKNKSYVVKRMRKGVREAELEYSLLDAKENISLVKIKLHTGRSHQIRVQFSSRKMPLVGDVKYGSTCKDCNIALWCEKIEFPHPRGGENLSFSAQPPEAFPWNKF